MKWLRVVWCLMLCAVALPAAAVNRCKMPDGKTVYQDAPCPAAAGSSQPVTTTGNTVAGMDPGVASRRARAIKAANPYEVVPLKCQRDFPDSPQARAGCERLQHRALADLETPIAGVPPQVASTIRVRCEYDWPDDFAARAACERLNANGWHQMQEMLPGDPESVAKARMTCRERHGNDFALRAACERQITRRLP